MPLSDFDYVLPRELIGQKPIKPRDHARLLILDKDSGRIEHKHFFDLPKILKRGDVLVFNDSKVIPARLFGTKETGGKVEIFLLKNEGKNIWQCIIGGKVKVGQKIKLAGKIEAEIVSFGNEKIKSVKFNCSDKKLLTLGETPLPPYIKNKSKLEDYQTVYAKKEGSVAAPTAGLHFTKKLLSQLKKMGVQIEYVTLHVGLGTFEPVKSENILEHKIHSEFAIIDKKTAERLNKAKAEGRRIISVGTTSTRTLEAFASHKKLISDSKWVNIFIYPGYEFKFIDGMITNFHLPKSSLVMLVSALAGSDKIKKVYKEAVNKKYKFYSFGDGMLIR
ncbi:MAG: tRNA preQ1(34) S-adenosylmethionine ribosyltransferase-isomerase QueA [Candidatus Buchananbacteria bacterium]